MMVWFKILFTLTVWSMNSGAYTELSRMEHRPYAGGAKIWKDGQTHNCQFFKIQLPVYDPLLEKNRNFLFEVSLPPIRGSVPAIIQITTTEGRTVLESVMRRQFCSEGMGHIISNINGFSLPKGPNGFQKFFEESLHGIRATRTLLDAFQSDQKIKDLFGEFYVHIDLKRIGVFGISNGVVPAVFLAAIDPRIQTMATLAGFANVADVMVETQNIRISKLVDEQMKQLKMRSREQVRAFLKEKIAVDPGDVGYLLKKGRVFNMVIADDPIIPTRHQIALSSSFPWPDQLVVGHGQHSEVIVDLASHRSGVYLDFFKKMFLL